MHDAKVKELEQKNSELETRLVIVEQSFLVMGGQPQDNKEMIAEMLPEIIVSDIDVSDSIIDQLKKHTPVYYVISENLKSFEETITNLLQLDYVYTNTSEVLELEHDDEIDIVNTKQIIEQ
ncbi:15431_t:CDS:2, partial [Dentiscutata heterogama]